MCSSRAPGGDHVARLEVSTTGWPRSGRLACRAAGAAPGTQLIRPADQVLWAPRHGTCLDLALVLAGACITSRAVHRRRRPGPRRTRRGRGTRWCWSASITTGDRAPTAGTARTLARRRPLVPTTSTRRGPGDVLAVDPVGFARPGRHPMPGWRSICAGRRQRRPAISPSGRWRLGVDVGTTPGRAAATPGRPTPARSRCARRTGAPDTADRRCGCCAPSTRWCEFRPATS